MTESSPPPSASDGARSPGTDGCAENEGKGQPDTWAQSPFNPSSWCPEERRLLIITFYGTVGAALATVIITAAGISFARRSNYGQGIAVVFLGMLLLVVGFRGWFSEKARWRTPRWRKAFNVLGLCGIGALSLGILIILLVLLGHSAPPAG